jgi:hypothetical protein
VSYLLVLISSAPGRVVGKEEIIRSARIPLREVPEKRGFR